MPDRGHAGCFLGGTTWRPKTRLAWPTWPTSSTARTARWYLPTASGVVMCSAYWPFFATMAVPMTVPVATFTIWMVVPYSQLPTYVGASRGVIATRLFT